MNINIQGLCLGWMISSLHVLQLICNGVATGFDLVNLGKSLTLGGPLVLKVLVSFLRHALWTFHFPCLV